MARVTVNELARRDPLDVMYDCIKDKGYVRIITTLGDLNIQLHCDLVRMFMLTLIFRIGSKDVP
jgi:hypothetical protein